MQWTDTKTVSTASYRLVYDWLMSDHSLQNPPHAAAHLLCQPLTRLLGVDEGGLFKRRADSWLQGLCVGGQLIICQQADDLLDAMALHESNPFLDCSTSGEQERGGRKRDHPVPSGESGVCAPGGCNREECLRAPGDNRSEGLQQEGALCAEAVWLAAQLLLVRYAPVASKC